MKRAIPLLLGLLMAAGAEDLTTTEGRVYKNVTVRKVEPDGLSISHESGLAKIPFSKLPAEVQKKHGYDPAKGKAYAEEEGKKQAAAEEQLAKDVRKALENQKEKDREHQVNEFKEDFAKKGRQTTVRIRQVTEDGFLGDWLFEGQELDFIMVLGTTRLLVDGEVWRGRLWPAGTYRYETAAGGTKTVRCYAMTPELALAALKAELQK
jgi:hypothetical protein